MIKGNGQRCGHRTDPVCSEALPEKLNTFSEDLFAFYQFCLVVFISHRLGNFLHFLLASENPQTIF